MSSMELEVKILNIDKEELENRIKEAGGKYISSSKQYLCVYDLAYINQRYNANLYELNNEKIELRREIAVAKIKNLFQEIDQLLSNKEIDFLKNNFKIDNLSQIFTFDKEQILNLLNSNKLKEFINNYKTTTKSGLD